MNKLHFQIAHVKYFTSRGLFVGRNNAGARSGDALGAKSIGDASATVSGSFSRDEGVAPTLCDMASQLP